jgi:hypothetical protein
LIESGSGEVTAGGGEFWNLIMVKKAKELSTGLGNGMASTTIYGN